MDRPSLLVFYFEFIRPDTGSRIRIHTVKEAWPDPPGGGFQAWDCGLTTAREE